MGVSNDALSFMKSYPWTGNVRELENTIERVFLYLDDGDTLKLEHLESILEDHIHKSCSESQLSLEEAVKKCEYELILKTLEECNWNRAEASRRLKVSRSSLFRKMKKLGLIKNNRNIQ